MKAVWRVKLSNDVFGWLQLVFALSTIVSFGNTSLGQSEYPDSSSSTPFVVDGAILKTIESISVSAQVAGVVSHVVVKEGSHVKIGTEVARIQDSTVRLQAEKAKLNVDVATKKKSNDIDLRLASKSKAVAENEYLRALQANNQVKGSYPINEIDRLKLVFDKTSLEIERAEYLRSMVESELSLAEIELRQSIDLLQRHRIHAPCEGIVVAVDKRVGEWVEPGTVLMKIVQTSRLRIEGFLNAKDASPDLLGSKATVKVESAGKMVETVAELVFISPDANPLNGEVRVFLEVDNTQGLLRPGLRPFTTLIKYP